MVGTQQRAQASIGIPFPRKWESLPVNSNFYSFVKRPGVKKLLRELKLPKHVQAIRESLDHIKKGQSILEVPRPIDLTTILLIVSHKNAAKVTDIRCSTWAPFELAKIKRKHANKLRRFKQTFSIEVPDFVLELRHYQECMKSLVADPEWFLDSEFGISGFSALMSCVFDDLEINESDAVLGKYLHDPLNYFPEFPTGTYQVSHGLIFDFQENCFSPFICNSDTAECSAWRSVWEILLEAFHPGAEDLSGDELEELEELERPALGEIEESLRQGDAGNTLLKWFFSRATVGYLNFHQLAGLKWTPLAKQRYAEYGSFESYLKEDKYIVTHARGPIYPRCVYSIDGNFHPSLARGAIEALLASLATASVEGWVSKRDFVKQFPVEAVALGLDANSHKHGGKGYFCALEQFANGEIAAGRPLLAMLIALYLWDDCMGANRKLTTRLAAGLLQAVPDELCHPLIKTTARLHSQTRFAKTIHTRSKPLS